MLTEAVELAERYWRHHRTRFLMPSGAALVFLALATDYGAKSLNFWHLFFAMLLALGLYAFWIRDNQVPRVLNTRVGVVLALTCDDESHERQVRADFVAGLRRIVHSDTATTRFQFVDLPAHHAKKCEDTETASAMLVKTRGHCLLFGNVRRRQVGGETRHLFALEGVVRHTNSASAVRRSISADFRAVLPRRCQFPLHNDALAFEITSEWTDLATRYVIAIAALASGDVWYAEQLLISVESRLTSASIRAPTVNNIARRLPSRFDELYSHWLQALYNAYFMSRDREFVEAGDQVARRALARNPRHYAGHLMAAIGEFLLRRDIAAAKREVMACRLERDFTWRYSLAFLYAYEGNMRRAREEYREAFRGRHERNATVPIEAEEFINLVLAEEPGKFQLHFALAQINQYAKEDYEAARRDYETFLAGARDGQFPEEVEIAHRQLETLPAHPGVRVDGPLFLREPRGDGSQQ